MHNPAATPAAAAAAMCIAAPRRGPVEWGIFVQRAMNARFIIIRGILAQDPAQVRLPKYGHARRIVPISLSTYGFCHGDRGAVGLSRMPMARKRCLKSRPYAVSRSRIRYR